MMRPTVPLVRFEVFADGLERPEGLAFDRDGDLSAGPLAFLNDMSLSTDERWLYIAQSTHDNVLSLGLEPDGRCGRPEVFTGVCRLFPTAWPSTLPETSTPPATPRAMFIAHRRGAGYRRSL